MIRPSCVTICGAALLATVAAAPVAASGGALTFVDKPTLDSRMRIVDVREQNACEKASLPGARCLPAADLFESNGGPVDFHTLRWLLGTIGLTGNERVLVAGADDGNAAAVGALLFLAGQRAVDVLDQPLMAPRGAEGGSARSITREAVFTAPMRDRLLVAATEQTSGDVIASGSPRERLRRFAQRIANATKPIRLQLTP